MAGRRRGRERISQMLAALVGLGCALVLGAVFYATMVYQLAGEERATSPEVGPAASPAPLVQGASVQALFPGALLALGSGELSGQHAQDVRMGGMTCRVVTRTYVLEDGSRALAVSATPAAYLERLAQEGWTPQLITGFVVQDMEAVYALLDQRGMLYARSGDCAYMIEANAGEQAMYALGASAYLEEAE